jgi:multicomponent Na+:H+ antiporter subunit E
MNLPTTDAGSRTPPGPRASTSKKELLLRFVIFSALWLVLSGHFEAEYLTLGLISVLAVLAVNKPIRQAPVEVDVDEDRWEFAPTLVHWGHLLGYVFWLVKEIVLANFQVAYMVLHPRLPASPVLVGFRVGLRSPIARVTLGNSITLTPGTLTLEIQEDWFLVHALSVSSAKSLLEGRMQQRVARVYRYDQGLVGEAKIYHSLEDLGR